MMTVFKEVILALLLANSVLCQEVGTCKDDNDCGKASESIQCCSRYGYCGSGEGYCRPIRGSNGKPVGTIESSCVMEGVELLGYDLPPPEGGGIKTDGPEGCHIKCSDIPECRFYTYDQSSRDNEKELCYLKYDRGERRSRGRGVISGSDVEGGCEDDPVLECEWPYQYYPGSNRFGRRVDDRCLYYCDEEYPDWGVYDYNMRRSFYDSQDFCRGRGGDIPYDLDLPGKGRFRGNYHWLNYSVDEGQCLATRPGMSRKISLPCSSQLNFACQRNSGYPRQVPPIPDYVRLRPRTRGGIREFWRLLQRMAGRKNALGGVGRTAGRKNAYNPYNDYSDYYDYNDYNDYNPYI